MVRTGFVPPERFSRGSGERDELKRVNKTRCGNGPNVGHRAVLHVKFPEANISGPRS